MTWMLLQKHLHVSCILQQFAPGQQFASGQQWHWNARVHIWLSMLLVPAAHAACARLCYGVL